MTAAAPFTPLAWDSEFFGMRVGRVDDASASDAALAGALERARVDGFSLVYWLAVRNELDPGLLSRFGGARVSGHRVYARALTRPPQDPAVRVTSALQRPVDARLRSLALLAGHLSRFRVDARLPAQSGDRMYELWIARSLSGEIATDVLVAGDDEGLVTVRVSGATATIGLLAVDPTRQGRGLGRALLAAAERRAFDAGATLVEVATQAENVAACRLYESGGYGVATDGSYHHFLLPS
jgi:dTDP-4-amino-4,6-dideoxy-D-galactose acyltransferase